MSTTIEFAMSERFRVGRIVLRYGIPLFLIYSAAAFLVEMYSGSCMFVVPIYFYALVTVLGVLKYQRFGTGLVIFLPFATLGVLMDYYGDWVYDQNLIGPWYALGWAPVFLGYGLAADLANRFAPLNWQPRWRAVAVGVCFGLAFYLLTLLALSTLYLESDTYWHIWHFREGVYFTLPWMLVNGGFGGYTACAILAKA